MRRPKAGEFNGLMQPSDAGKKLYTPTADNYDSKL
jgi:hypothetical protein